MKLILFRLFARKLGGAETTPGGRGVLRISSDRDVRMGRKNENPIKCHGL